MIKQCCGTCEHLRVSPDKDGKIRVRKDNTYGCKVPLPEFPALPDCFNVTPMHWYPGSFTKIERIRNGIGRDYMQPEQGTECPGWEPRK